MRRQDKPDHQIPSFARYLNKVFDFRSTADSLADSGRTRYCGFRRVPRSLSSFFVPSARFQQLESELISRPSSAGSAPIVP